MSSLRRCPVRGHIALLAPERVRPPAAPAALREGPCPLCEVGRGSRALGRRNLAFSCAVARPILRVEAEAAGFTPGPFAERDGLGAHELVLPDPRHEPTPGQLSPGAWSDALLLARERMRDLRQDLRLRGLTWFSPWRAEAGALHDHVHLQILAVPEPFPREPGALASEGACPSCAHLHQRGRLVRESALAAVICPWAPAVDFEVWVLPRAHGGSFEEAPDSLLVSAAGLLSGALAALERALGPAPLHLALRSGAPGEGGHWRIEVQPLLQPRSPVEAGAGLRPLTVPPEESAEHLRACLADLSR